jgi:hypothetical protein
VNAQPLTLGNMRELGVRGLAVYCLNHACRHQRSAEARGGIVLKPT